MRSLTRAIAEGRQSPILGDGVFIGAGAKIIEPVTIGSHCRTGANAVVVKSVPAGATAVGVPATIVRSAPQAVEVGA